MNYEVVFNILPDGLWAFFGLIPAFLCLKFFLWIVKSNGGWNIPNLKDKISIFSAGIFLLSWIFMFSFGSAYELSKLLFAYYQKDYEVKEGIVKDYRPLAPLQKGYESFVVEGRRFSYSGASVSFGFNDTAAGGSPIREGRQVRISHVGNIIILLEVEAEPKW
ncbi:hypothetical protein [Enterovibrio norvegicus]|uniref:hypothetical protein n=1 Tax=Enterovibrio norvegicus TaxID=188144 RepID=UPI000C85280D|nr:hypothetical protein [Enterovibrio norvegicus]PMH72064.1 hypothetical protein BCU62_03310 [Enterovibrio norvegicus]